MASLSPAIAELARKNERTVLQAFSRVSQARIAEQLGIDDSRVSRFKDGGLEQAAALLAACGLKVVPIEMQCFPQDKIHALLTLARDHLVQMEHPEQLSWE
ncbi:MAG TPA: CII family transcriptional regulator [Burkholderiaceae bacterium]